MKRRVAVMVDLFALCSLTAYAIVAAPPALAAGKSTSTLLKSWYLHTGGPALAKMAADAQRFSEATAATTASDEHQYCEEFRVDVLSASKEPPPQQVLAHDYHYFLLAAAKSFEECMTGTASNDLMLAIKGIGGGELAVEAVVKIIQGAQAGQVVAISPSTTNLIPSIPTSILVPQCEADFKILEIAVQAYLAQRHGYPKPPKPWSASTYVKNYDPLLSTKDGGPYMNESFDPTYFVIEYDSSGHVWVEPAGNYVAKYNLANGTYTACAAVVK